MGLMAAHGKGKRDFWNLLRNGSIYDDVSQWHNPYGPAPTFNATSRSADGSGSMRLAKASDKITMNVFERHHGGQPFIDASEIAAFDLVSYIRPDVSGVAGGFKINWYDENFSSVSAPSFDKSVGSMTANQWNLVGGTNIAKPAGGVYAWPQFYISKNAASVVALIDDIYFGKTGKGGGPYARNSDTRPASGERVPGGDMESGIGLWQTWWGDEVVSDETASPIAGAHSLKCVATDEDDESGVYTHYSLCCNPGEDLRCRLKLKGPASLEVHASYQSNDSDSVIWSGEIGSGVESLDETWTVPDDSTGGNGPGPFFFSLMVYSTAPVNQTFYVDDVSIVEAA